jgi:hypothetical protein
VASHRAFQPHLELVEEGQRLPKDGLGAHVFRSPTCSATIPPASRR